MNAGSIVAGIADGVLSLAAEPVLRALDPAWSLAADPSGAGVFLQAPAPSPACWHEQPLGRFAGPVRFTSGSRFSPFWTRPVAGRGEAEVAPETLWLLAEADSGRYVLIVPLLGMSTRYALGGSAAGLVVTAETGDTGVACEGGVAVFIAQGPDPFELLAAGARAVQAYLGSGALRADRPLPDFVDLFGWCTWDAFYKAVSPEAVLHGLETLAAAGVPPRLLILDDGWQSWRSAASGEDRLTSLAPNARFGGDLSPLVQACKQHHGVQRFLVWHALLGYWGGLCETALPDYGTRTVARSFGPGLLAQQPRWNHGPWGAQVGVPAADQLAAFYDDLHASLARQGVDGVKVDVQGMLEAVSQGQGGRVALARAVRQALDSSAARHFGGRLINCMSCTPETTYLAGGSRLMRSSDDFFPRLPETQGMHLYANAQSGLWLGEFMQPDWDMFQSRHERGAFHAAARAISGGPIYVSDKPGEHDAALLRKLVLSDGTVLRAELPARPTRDNLFDDPTREQALLKIWNRHRDAGVIGLFNLRYALPPGAAPIEGAAAACDVPGLQEGDCVAFAHRSGRIGRVGFEERWPVALAEGEWELVTYVPIDKGFAAIGLGCKFNSAAAIVERRWEGADCHLLLRDGGDFLAWAERAPRGLWCDGVALGFAYDAATGRLEAALPAGGRRGVVVGWG